MAKRRLPPALTRRDIQRVDFLDHALNALYTHISDRYAPFHVKVITGTGGEAIHVLDGLVSHDSAIDILAHHTDGGGVSDHVFAAVYLLGVKFQPRMSNPNDRRPTPSRQRAAMVR